MSALPARPLIYLITSGDLTPQNFAAESAGFYATIKVAVENEISLIQIREKNLNARLIFELTAEAVRIAERSKTKILVSDRADIALAAGANGVQLTEKSLRPQVIREKFPPQFIIGVSAHSLAGIENAARQQADFATFSPIFDSLGKGKAQGLDELAAVCRKMRNFPVIALGGIDAANYETVLNAGASGFAAIRFLNDAHNLRKTASELRK